MRFVGIAVILVLAISVSPAARGAILLVANKSDHTIDLVDPATGSSGATLPTGHAPHEVAVSPDGKMAVVANYGDRSAPGSSLTVIDLERAAVQSTVDLGRHTRPHGVRWISDTDLAVTTDYRRVISEILIRRLGNPYLDFVFPGYKNYQPLGIVQGEDIEPKCWTKVFIPQVLR